MNLKPYAFPNIDKKEPIATLSNVFLKNNQNGCGFFKKNRLSYIS